MGRHKIAEFASCHPHKPYQAKGLCKSCYNRENRNVEGQRQYQRDNRERLNKARLARRINARTLDSTFESNRYYKAKHKISYEQAVAILKVQGGVCAICKTQLVLGVNRGRYRPHLDHDHKTGKIRGFLCAVCNLDLVPLEKGKKHLKALLEYLEYHACH